MNEADRWVAVAVVARPHALGGLLIVKPLTRTLDDFFDAPIEKVYLRRRGRVEGPFALERLQVHKGLPMVALEGIEDRTAAEGIQGAELVIPEEERWELPEGQYYTDDLLGMMVHDAASGRDLGPVVRVQEGTAYDYLLLNHPDRKGGDLLVPFKDPVLVTVNLGERRIEVRLPEGLLEI